MKCRIN